MEDLTKILTRDDESSRLASSCTVEHFLVNKIFHLYKLEPSNFAYCVVFCFIFSQFYKAYVANMLAF